MENIRRSNKKLGVGARGVVYEGYDEERGRFVAVKEIPLYDGGAVTFEGDEGNTLSVDDSVLAEDMWAILQEIRLMERLQHPNLVMYYGARRSTVGVEIVMEYVNGGSLEGIIRRQGSLRESVVRSYASDLLEGLAYLHETARICHRDIKPANVLITADGRCKLADFGVSKLIDGSVGMHTTVGTPWYMAPEVVDSGGNAPKSAVGVSVDIARHTGDDTETNTGGGGSYTTAADVWSLGVTVYEMITGRKPFGGSLKNPAAVLFAIVSNSAGSPRLPADCGGSSLLQDFLDLCFVRDPSLRPSARELLSHRWLHETVSPNGARCERRDVLLPDGSGVALRSRAVEVPCGVAGSAFGMMDTADLFACATGTGGASQPAACPVSGERTLGPNSGGTAKRRECGKYTTGGFFLSDGHFVDLAIPHILCSHSGGMKE